MTLEEIKKAVNEGKHVYWCNENYEVVKDKYDQWFIVCYIGNTIGLTWRDGKTLNGKEEEFYIGE